VYCISIQGSTLSNYVLNLNKKMARELLYVGCSRAKTLNDLYIKGTFVAPKAPGPDDPVTLEMARLRRTSGTLCLRFLQDVGNDMFKVVFHNVRRLIPHLLDIRADHSTMSADLLAFVEPWLIPGHSGMLEGFNISARTNCPSAPNSYGSILYSRDGVILQSCEFSSIFSGAGHIDVTAWQLQGIQFFMIYSHPSAKYDELVHALSPILQPRTPTVVVGDFNLDFLTDFRLLKFFLTHGMREVTANIPSTDYGSKLDGCFSNIREVDAWIFESLFSDHKPICVTISKKIDLHLLSQIELDMFSRKLSELSPASTSGTYYNI
jgi:hypothetical protein